MTNRVNRIPLHFVLAPPLCRIKMQLTLRVSHPDRGINVQVAQFVAVVGSIGSIQCYKCAIPKSLCMGPDSLLQVYVLMPPTTLQQQQQLYILGQDPLPSNSLVHLGKSNCEDDHIYFALPLSTTLWAATGAATAAEAETAIKALFL